MKNLILVVGVFLFLSCKDKQVETWIPLFNGKDLEGWTVKIKGYPAGDNFGNTFRVEDGIMKVNYDAYNNEFKDRFGHIFTNKSYSRYKLRVEYRFVGEQLPDGAGWAYRNSGAMLHAQDPFGMHLDQDFPVSLEAQFLGGDGTGERTTGNVCTPGTDVYMDGEKCKGHCMDSHSKTYNGDTWVTIEMIVLGDSIAHHVIEGDTVITYSKFTADGKGINPPVMMEEGPLKEGRIALQSESHPIEFRKIEILELK